MRIFCHLTAMILLLLLTVTVSGVGNDLKAQAPYLEGIGGTESDLIDQLDRANGNPYVRKPYPDVWVVNREDLQATYNFRDGKVTDVHLNQYFINESEAEEAMADSEKFLKGRGVFLEQVSNDANTEVLRGQGSGLNAHLMMHFEPDGRYRMNIGLSCRGR